MIPTTPSPFLGILEGESSRTVPQSPPPLMCTRGHPNNPHSLLKLQHRLTPQAPCTCRLSFLPPRAGWAQLGGWFSPFPLLNPCWFSPFPAGNTFQRAALQTTQLPHQARGKGRMKLVQFLCQHMREKPTPENPGSLTTSWDTAFSLSPSQGRQSDIKLRICPWTWICSLEP